MKKILYYWAKFFKKIKYKAILNSKIHHTSKVEAGSEFINSTMDKHSFCGYDCEIINCDIGSFCSIANRVVIGGGMHPMGWVSTSPVFYEGKDSVKQKFSEHKRVPPRKTIIGHDVWIGEYAILKQGIKIGTGAVIGMGSVVTKDVEPYSIVGGNPAKEIRKRFDSETIDELLKSKWWDYSDKELNNYAKYFNEPQEFLKKLK
ncbi:MAG: CatB-related O-acetyltransferase [Deltaproteobacteria bacterium]